MRPRRTRTPTRSRRPTRDPPPRPALPCRPARQSRALHRQRLRPRAHSRSHRHPDPDAVWPHRSSAMGTARQAQPSPASTVRRHRCNPHCGRNRCSASPPPKCAMTSYADQRRAMVREQLSQRGIRDPHVLAAFTRVPRHCYVPEALRSHAYADHPLAIGADQTISQPYVVAYMLSVLGLQGNRTSLGDWHRIWIPNRPTRRTGRPSL